MSIESYVGFEGVCFTVTDEGSVWQVVDCLQTTVMDELGEDNKAVAILSDCMDKLESELGIDISEVMNR